MGKRLGTVWGMMTAVGCVLFAGEYEVRGAGVDKFFGLTNLWEVRIQISAEQWAMIEPKTPQRGPGRMGPPGLDGGPGGADRAADRGAGGEGRPGAGRPFGPPPVGMGMGPGMGPGPGRVEFPMVKGSIQIGGETISDVGLRFKGNSSFNFARNSLKKSFKIDFDETVKGQNFRGLTKLNLNNNAMDATLVRESVAYEVFRRAGIPAARTAFARVYLTVPGAHENRFLGVYTVVEQLDKTFVKRAMGGEETLLMKPERTRGIPYLGEEWERYAERLGVKLKGTKAQRQGFVAFAKWLKETETDAAAFERGLEERVDVRELLRFVALNGMLANLDSFLSSGHNFYIAVSPSTGKVMWLPWDLNEAFGRFRMGASVSDMIDLSVAHPYAGNDALLDRVLAVPRFRSMYEQECGELQQGAFEERSVIGFLESAAQVVAEVAAAEFNITKEAYLANAVGVGAVAGVGGSRGEGRVEGGKGGMPQAGDFGRMRADQGGMSLVEWTRKRVTSVRAQLAGEKEGVVPRGMRGPMGGGPGPGPGPDGGPGMRGRGRPAE